VQAGLEALGAPEMLADEIQQALAMGGGDVLWVGQDSGISQWRRFMMPFDRAPPAAPG
jgi:hypothetical protein